MDKFLSWFFDYFYEYFSFYLIRFPSISSLKDAFIFAKEKGLPTTGYYPYRGTENTCKWTNQIAKAKNITIIDRLDTSKLIAYLRDVGPITAGMYASAAAFKNWTPQDEEDVADGVSVVVAMLDSDVFPCSHVFCFCCFCFCFCLFFACFCFMYICI